MEINTQIKNIIDTSSASNLMRSTIYFIKFLHDNNVEFTEAIFKQYMSHVKGRPNISSSELFEGILRDHFALFAKYMLLADQMKPVLSNIPNENTSSIDETELTPEMIRRMAMDCGENLEEEEEVDEWFAALNDRSED